MAEETNPHLTTASLQVAVESWVVDHIFYFVKNIHLFRWILFAQGENLALDFEQGS